MLQPVIDINKTAGAENARCSLPVSQEHIQLPIQPFYGGGYVKTINYKKIT